MIPKVIHYCWFGRGPLPDLAKKCIASWKKFLPDYKIKEWNEDNFDVNVIPYTREAYAAKKYAFVSDYARFEILYKYGGLYFDTDVEVIKPLDDIISRGSFMGCERNGLAVAPGLGIGVVAEHPLYAELLSLYAGLHFQNPNGTLNLKTVVQYTTETLDKHGLRVTDDIQECDGMWIYPTTYFCPISVDDGKLRISDETRTIHHYAQSWQSPTRKYARKIALRIGGEKLKRYIKKILRM